MCDDSLDSASKYRLSRMTLEEREEFYDSLGEYITRDNDDKDSDNDVLVDSTVDDEVFVRDGDASDADDDVVVEGPSDVEDSDDEEALEELYDLNNAARIEQETDTPDGCLMARDGTVWAKAPPSSYVPLKNNFSETGGTVKSFSNPLEIFKSIITTEMVVIIVRETNKKAMEATAKFNSEKSSKRPRVWKIVNRHELFAYFGLLLAGGVNQWNDYHTKELWQTTSMPVFRATMSLQRFWAITRFIRFDNHKTRETRQRLDRAAPIRAIWSMFNHKLESAYTPKGTIALTDQLFPYRGNTKFTQYIPTATATPKYGIKVTWACDASNSYPLQGILHTGKDQSQANDVALLHITNKYWSSGRTICAEHCFTSIESAKKLKTVDLGYVGAIQQSKKYIPNEMLPHRSRQVYSTEFGFLDQDVALVSYVPTKNKATLLLSTVHFDTETAGPASKPQAIAFYNQNKCSLDEVLAKYTCKRRTQRWPLAFFYNMLDVAAFASYTIHSILNPNTNKDARRLFLNTLVDQLVRPQIEDRMNSAQTMKQFSPRSGIEAYLGYQRQEKISVPSTSEEQASLSTKRSCKICWYNDKLQRKTRFDCMSCLEAVCLQHSHKFQKCFKCVNGTKELTWT